jgi:hypothetical protein
MFCKIHYSWAISPVLTEPLKIIIVIKLPVFSIANGKNGLNIGQIKDQPELIIEPNQSK